MALFYKVYDTLAPGTIQPYRIHRMHSFYLHPAAVPSKRGRSTNSTIPFGLNTLNNTSMPKEALTGTVNVFPPGNCLGNAHRGDVFGGRRNGFAPNSTVSVLLFSIALRNSNGTSVECICTSDGSGRVNQGLRVEHQS